MMGCRLTSYRAEVGRTPSALLMSSVVLETLTGRFPTTDSLERALLWFGSRRRRPAEAVGRANIANVSSRLPWRTGGPGRQLPFDLVL